MSNDLISRSALIEALKKYCGKQPYLVSENIWEIVKNEPTAYDVDKVVERIENIMDDESIRFVDQAVRRSVNIVKAGGVNE